MNILNLIKEISVYVSALLAPIVTICTICFMRQQKEIQKKQQLTELFKLRIKHMNFLFESWGNFNTYITYIPNYEAKIISINGNQDIIISQMQQVFAKLYELNFETKVLFNKNIEKLEKEFINSLPSMIPPKNGDWTDYKILKNYEISKNLFNYLFSKYQELLCKEGKICQ